MTGARVDAQMTADLGRPVLLRRDTSDRQVWADTFTGRYHLPPDDMPAPSTVLDVGANIGLTAAHYRALWPTAQIVAVEMDADCADLARQNAPGVDIQCHAVSALGGWGWFNTTARAEAYTFVRGGAGRIEPQGILGPQHGMAAEGRKLVDSFTLRQTIRRSFMVPDNGPLDFLKLDVEGEEWALFAAPSWADLVRHMVVELHALDAATTAELVISAIDRLTAIGFEARHHPPHPQSVYAWRP